VSSVWWWLGALRLLLCSSAKWFFRWWLIFLIVIVRIFVVASLIVSGRLSSWITMWCTMLLVSWMLGCVVIVCLWNSCIVSVMLSSLSR